MMIISLHSVPSALIIIVVIGVLFSLIYGASLSREQASDTYFDMLEGKKAEVIIHRVKDPTAIDVDDKSKDCIVTVNSQQLSKYPLILSTMNEADSEASIDSPDVHNNLYSGYFQHINSSEAVSLVREYDAQFHHTIQHKVIREHYIDNVHSYSCYFWYTQNEYYLEMTFRSLSFLDDYGGFVPIDITKQAINSHRWPPLANLNDGSTGNSDAGINPMTVYYSFNNTGVWTNGLDKAITVKLSFPRSEDDGQVSYRNESGIPTSDMITVSAKIFPGMSWDYGLGPDYGGLVDKKYHYEIVEYPWITGDIIVKYYPRCMTEEVAKSLYQQSDGFEVKFPSYLPLGYDYICGLQYDRFMLLQTYWNNSKDTVKDFEGSYAFHDQALEEGLIQIFAMKQGGIAHPEVNKTAEERLGELTQGEDSKYYLDAKLVTIKEKDGQAKSAENRDSAVVAVAYKRNWGGDWANINILEVFDNKTPNHSEEYILRGKMPLGELVKIAQSMYSN